MRSNAEDFKQFKTNINRINKSINKLCRREENIVTNISSSSTTATSLLDNETITTKELFRDFIKPNKTSLFEETIETDLDKGKELMEIQTRKEKKSTNLLKSKNNLKELESLENNTLIQIQTKSDQILEQSGIPIKEETKMKPTDDLSEITIMEQTIMKPKSSRKEKDPSTKVKTESMLSNLTIMEPTHSLDEYYQKYKDKYKDAGEEEANNELESLEPADTVNEDHGINECDSNLHDVISSVPYEYQNYLGMTVTSGIVVIAKDTSNLIGISIGGGAPLCPCLYIVQVFDNTPASKEGTLQSGDEIVGVNGTCVKGKTKVEVAKMIQSAESEVSIKYNKLHADPQQGKSLDIILKKVKHRLVENMSTTTADALGLSRAILCNDTLVKKMEELEQTEQMYKGLVDHCKKVLKMFLALLHVYKAFGDAFAGIGVREPQPRASEAFRQFGEYHRQMEKNGIGTIKSIKPILSDLGTYLNKAIPDTKLTIRKYADTKFEYLSYCLKVKEMDDEEYSYATLQEPLYRVETGNYEYRLILRCRQDARLRFAALRSDVLVKLELLDNKHVQDVVWQLQRFIAGLASFHTHTLTILKENSLFPIEMDLSRSSFQYESTDISPYEENHEEDEEKDEELIIAEEVKADDESGDQKEINNSELMKQLNEISETVNLLDL